MDQRRRTSPPNPEEDEFALDLASYGVTDPNELYLRCPSCHYVAQSDSITYTLTPGGGVRWLDPIIVRCQICHGEFNVYADLPLSPLVVADAEVTCARCGQTSPAPRPRPSAPVAATAT
jgi:hypothetical protein